MTQVGEIIYDARIDTKGLKTDAKRASGIVDGTSKDISKSSDRASNSADKMGMAFKVAGIAIAGAAVAAGAVVVSVFAKAIPDAISRLDTLTNAPKVLKNLGYSAEESAAAIKKIEKGLKGLPTPLNEGVSALMRFVTTTNKGVDYATDLTLAFNNMGLAGGKGPVEASRAMVQLTQMLGRGKVEMQDWNTLMEVMPAQLKQVATEMLGTGASSMDLYDALQNGTISMEQFTDQIVKLDKEGGAGFASFSQQAKDGTAGVQTSIDNMNTAITRATEGIILAIGVENIQAATTAIGDFFEKDLAPKIETAVTKIKDELLPGLQKGFEDSNNSLKPLNDSLGQYNANMGGLRSTGEFIGTFFAVIGTGINIFIASIIRFFVVTGDIIASVIWFFMGLGATIDKFVYDATMNINKFVDDTMLAIGNWIVETRDGIFKWGNSILETVTNTWNNVWAYIQYIVNMIKQYFAGAWNWLVGAGRDMVSGFISGITGMIGGVLSGARQIWNDITGFFSGAGGWLYNSGKSLIDGFIGGIKSMLGGAKKAAEDVVKAVRDFFPFSPAKEGPFSGKGWTLYSGMSIMDGLAEGIKKNSGLPQLALDAAMGGVSMAADISGIEARTNTSSTNIYGNINIADKQTADYFFDRLSKNADVAGRGLAGVL